MEENMEKSESIEKLEKYEKGEVETIYRKSKNPISKSVFDGIEDLSVRQGLAFSFRPDFNQRSYSPEEGIICEQDVGVKMRDGVMIYADIYRPEDETKKIPVILSWSPFGKRPFEGAGDWQAMGVPPGTLSGMMKFESCDPGYWCHNGYAVANVDPRGIGWSEGDVNLFGTQDGLDGYDFIEWIAQQPWCNGKVTLYGNSGVAMTQWRIAAEQPPHLACIAPWEGSSDIYRETFFEGGIPAITFNEFIIASLTGDGYIDDMVAMARKYPLMNPYWEDKIPKFANVRVPAYVAAGWQHFHLRGTVNAFRKIKSPKKWIRIHSEFEWPDAYNPDNLEDLKHFYDRYCKNIRNGWELTPKIRLDVMDAGSWDIQKKRPEIEFPLARTQYKKLYVDAASHALSLNPVEKESKVSYDGKEGQVTFDIRFDEDTELTGYMKLRLWVEADGHDDMDMFINIQKLDLNGNFLATDVLGEHHPGAWGKMRASRRKLDEKLSTSYNPVQAHTVEEKLKPKEIVPVDIEIVPHSRFWHKGESLRVEVAGRYIRDKGWFEPLGWDVDNKGNHIIHSGGQYDSYLQIPVVPPKYQVGDYIYR